MIITPFDNLFSLDVVDLYPSIPWSPTVDATQLLLSRHRNDLDLFGFEVDDIVCFLDFLLRHFVSRCGKYFYWMKTGVPTGSHSGRIMADILLHSVEHQLVARPELLFFRRYVDDSVGIWRGPLAGIQQLLHDFNAVLPAIQFTLELNGPERRLPFLDLHLQLKDNDIYYTLYRKPTHPGRYPSFESFIPATTKVALVVGESRRALRNTSDPWESQKALVDLKGMFLKSDFPTDVVDRALLAAQLPPSRREPHGPVLVLPFLGDSFAAVTRRTLRREGCNVRISFRRPPNLAQLLRPTDPITTSCTCECCRAGIRCTLSWVVYHLVCRLCSADYIGRTYRPFGARWKEHVRVARGKSGESAMGQHLLTEHHLRPVPFPVSAECLAHLVNFKSALPAAEYLCIKDKQPSLNIQYDHF